MKKIEAVFWLVFGVFMCGVASVALVLAVWDVAKVGASTIRNDVPLDPGFNLRVYESELNGMGDLDGEWVVYNYSNGQFIARDKVGSTIPLTVTVHSYAEFDVNPLQNRVSYVEGSILGDPAEFWSYPAANGLILQAGGVFTQSMTNVQGLPIGTLNDRVKKIRVPTSCSGLPLDPGFNLRVYESELNGMGDLDGEWVVYNYSNGQFIARDKVGSTIPLTVTVHSYAEFDVNPLQNRVSYVEGSILGDPAEFWSYPAANGLILQAGGVFTQSMTNVQGLPIGTLNDRVKKIRVPTSCSGLPLDPGFNLRVYESELNGMGDLDGEWVVYNYSNGQFIARDKVGSTIPLTVTVHSYAEFDVNPLQNRVSYVEGSILGDPAEFWSYPAANGLILQAGGVFTQSMTNVQGLPIGTLNDRVKKIRVPTSCSTLEVTETPTPTSTNTPTPTATPTETAYPAPSDTPTFTETPSPTPTVTSTPRPTHHELYL